jgi:pyochelin biosynthesis protein PchC
MSTATVTQRRGWLRVRRPRPDAGVRLVCLPHAGGTASTFRTWPDAVPAGVEVVAVQYPGREDRVREEPWTNAVAMARHVAGLLASDPRPVVLFGHSLGATIAYEIARRIPVRRMVVSARIAPTVPPARVFRGRTDEELAAELHRLGGTSAAVLEHAELRALVLPAFRADLRAADGYVHADGPPLTCPVRLLLGADDPAVDPASAARWAEVAPAGFSVRTFPGGHFYLHEQRDAVLAETLRDGPGARMD